MAKLRRLGALWRLQKAAGVNSATALARIAQPKLRTRLAGTLLEYFPRRILQDVHMAVDVGAHRGEWTAGILALYPCCSVVAFEPTPNTVHKLKQRFAGDARVHIIERAIGSEVRLADLHEFRGSDLNSLRRANSSLTATIGETAAEVGTVPVVVSSLDEEVRDLARIDILKIDVQGNEMDVLLGAQRTLCRTTSAVIETNFIPQYEGAPTFKEVDRVMAAAGLLFYGFTRIHRRSDGAAIWTDAIFCRSDDTC